MGFRGEALASIAAISKIKINTKTQEEEMGTMLQLEAGDVISSQPVGTAVGTSITVEDLFFNTPVRYKFLKKEYTEAGYIEEVVRRMAIINKEIAFKLINNGKTIVQTNGSAETKLVVYSIFGEEIANSIIETEYETEDFKISAIVGKPEIARSNRRNQLFFVNGRYIKDNTLTAATTKAFKGLVPLGRFGFCILDIRINPKLIDVNVHPTKEEIRFKDEKEIFKAVNTVIHNALAKSELVENIFVPKYDDKNFTHFNNYAVSVDSSEKENLKEVDEILHQPEDNMIESKRKAGFFNFKEKKSDKDIEEEELEKKHSEIYETLMKNPKFSYEEMLKETEEENEEEQETTEDGSLPRLDWIGDEQTTEKLSKIQEKIKKSSSMSIHTILNRYKEQLDEEEAEIEEKMKAGLISEEQEESEVVKEEHIQTYEEGEIESEEQKETEPIEETTAEIVAENEQEFKENQELELKEEIEDDSFKDQDETLEEKQRIAEEKYKALFETYKAGDYLKEEQDEPEKQEEISEEREELEQEEPEVVKEEHIETYEEEKVELEKQKETEPIEEIVEENEQDVDTYAEETKVEQEEQEFIEESIPEDLEKTAEIKTIDESSTDEQTPITEGNSILEKIQDSIAKEAITATPTLKPLAQEDREESNDKFSDQIRESLQKQTEETESDSSDFKTAEEESFVEEEDISKKLKEKIYPQTENTSIEVENIVESLIAQKIEKGEITEVLDVAAINKILEKELKDKAEIENLKKESLGTKFDFSKMYKRAFGVDPYEEQQQKKAFEESMDMSQSFKTPEVSLFSDTSKPIYSVIGVFFGTYIIIEMKDSIYMIDQHATHERLLYEEVKFNYYNDQYKDSQTLLLPDVITLSYREMEIVRKNIEVFQKSGFELEEFGINTIKLIAVPSMTEILDTKELFLDILDELDSVYVTGKDEIEERFLTTIACKAAVKANMALDEKEIRALLDDLFELQNPFTCPHGRPTAIKMTKADLERKFARR